MIVPARLSILLLGTVLLSAPLASARTPLPNPPATSPWEMQNSTSKAGLRGIHAVGGGVAWASGTDGTVLRTEDGGYMWQSCAMPPGAEKLDFRGIWAWDADNAMVMSSGPGNLSRIYKTTDGCSSWKLLYTNPDKEGFWDVIQFRDRDRGVIFGDPVHGVFTLLNISTQSGRRDTKESLPATPQFDSAGAFAASNSALVLGPERGPSGGTELWLGIGGKDGAKVLRLPNGIQGQTKSQQWLSSAVPVASGSDSSGVFSLGFRDADHGVAVGGDYKQPDVSAGSAAYTVDGGKTWTESAKPPHGYRSSVAWDEADRAWIAAGTNGSDISYDDGKTWASLDSGKWNALSLPWVVGPEGRIAKLVSLKAVAKTTGNATEGSAK
jgi:photosystem II stability/assembly factor-like uncharacterized protein